MTKANKSEKTTQIACTGETLRTARKTLGLNQVEMASSLQTPLRSYQDWEGGRRRVPGVVAVAVCLLQERDQWVMQAIGEKIERDLDRDHRFLPRRQS